MSDCILTVVTATRNAVQCGRIDLLERCIRSVAAIRAPHEHLIYDGVSTDGTVERLMKWRNEIPGLKVVSESDTGIYNALNKGVRDAAGVWLYVLGDDDYVFAPAVMTSAIQSASDADEMIISFVRRCDGSMLPRDTTAMRSLFYGFAYCHQGVIMKTDLVRRLGGFDLKYKITADYNLILKAHLAKARVHYAWEPYANFTIGGISDTDPERTRDDFAQILADNLGLTDAQKQEVRSRRIVPIRKMLPFVFSGYEITRIAAIHQIKRRIADLLGLLDANGNPRRK